MRKPFMLISVLPITVHISHDTDTASNRIGGIPEKYAFKNKVLRSICFVLFYYLSDSIQPLPKSVMPPDLWWMRMASP